MPSPPRPVARPEFSPKSILRAIWKHRFTVICVASVVGLSGILFTRHMPPVYEAEALIIVDPQKIPDRFVSSTISEEFADRLVTMNQEILSSTRLRKIIDEFGLYGRERQTHVMDELVAMMRKDISVSIEKSASGNRPGAFRITYRAFNPVLAARVVDRITRLYIEGNTKDRELQSEGTSEFLENQLKDAKRMLDQQEAAVSRYKIEHNGELPEQQNTLAAALSRLQIELEGNQDAMTRAEQSRIALENGVANSRAVENALRNRPRALGQSNEQVASMDRSPEPVRESEALALRLESARLRYGDMHPDVRRLRDQLEAARRREQAESHDQPVQATRRPGAEVKPPEAGSDLAALQAHQHTMELEAELAAVRQEISRRRDEREHVLREIASYQQRIEALPLREQEYARLTRDYDFSKANYRVLLDKRMAAEMATDLEKRQKAERFRILDPPRPPQKPVKPNRPLLYAISLAGGLLVGFAASVLQEMRSDVLLGEWELPPGTPILVRISRIDLHHEITTNDRLQTFRDLTLRSIPLMIMVLMGHRPS